MGIKSMQGVSAHIEYLKKDPDSIEKVNCKFWKNEICYNNISLKYGERCWSKRGCMYSIPLPKKSTKSAKKKIPPANLVGGGIKASPTLVQSTKLSVFTMKDIINNYFSKEITKVIKIEEKAFNVKGIYNKGTDILYIIIMYTNRKNKFEYRYKAKLRDVISIQGNEVIFKIKIIDVKNSANKFDERLSNLIKLNNDKDIVRRAMLNNNEEIIKSRDSLIMFTSYVITRELIKIYK